MQKSTKWDVCSWFVGRLPKIMMYLSDLAENSGEYKRIGIYGSQTMKSLLLEKQILDKIFTGCKLSQAKNHTTWRLNFCQCLTAMAGYRFVILTWKAVLEEWYCTRIIIYHVTVTYIFRFTKQQNPAFKSQRRFFLDQWINRNCSSAAINLEFCWLYKPEQNTCLHPNRKYLKIQLMLIIFSMFVTSLN